MQDDLALRTGRFFRASEIVGYMIRAVHEYRAGHRPLGQQVFVNQYVDIAMWADEFAAVRVIFGEFRDEVERALREDPACVRLAEDRGKAASIAALLAKRGNGAMGETIIPTRA